MIYETNSAKETFELGRYLSGNVRVGSVICLDGDLGVGKTVFTKGFADGLQIKEEIVSPTFTILQIYDNARVPLYHFDVYRIGDPEEMYEIGFEDYFFGEGISLVEWAALIEDLIPKDAVRIMIEKDLAKGLNYRKIIVEGL